VQPLCSVRQEAAAKGLDVLLLASADVLSRHTDKLREQSVSYEVVEMS
jgi:putative transcriptional regulator